MAAEEDTSPSLSQSPSSASQIRAPQFVERELNIHPLEPIERIPLKVDEISKISLRESRTINGIPNPNFIEPPMDFSGYTPIFIFTHMEYMKLHKDYPCRDVLDQNNYLFSNRLNDLYFRVPENHIIVDPLSHGGLCNVDETLDRLLIEQCSDPEKLDLFLKDQSNLNKKSVRQKKAYRYLQTEMKIYFAKDYYFNYKIDFERTQSEDQLWGIYTFDDKKKLVPIEFLMRPIRPLARVKDITNCTELRSVILAFLKHPYWASKKIAFFPIGCRPYPYIDIRGNLPELPEYLKEELSYDEQLIKKYQLNMFQDIIINNILIPILLNNGKFNRSFITSRIGKRPYKIHPTADRFFAFYQERDVEDVEQLRVQHMLKQFTRNLENTFKYFNQYTYEYLKMFKILLNNIKLPEQFVDADKKQLIEISRKYRLFGLLPTQELDKKKLKANIKNALKNKKKEMYEQEEKRVDNVKQIIRNKFKDSQLLIERNEEILEEIEKTSPVASIEKFRTPEYAAAGEAEDAAIEDDEDYEAEDVAAEDEDDDEVIEVKQRKRGRQSDRTYNDSSYLPDRKQRRHMLKIRRPTMRGRGRTRSRKKKTVQSKKHKKHKKSNKHKKSLRHRKSKKHKKTRRVRYK